MVKNAKLVNNECIPTKSCTAYAVSLNKSCTALNHSLSSFGNWLFAVDVNIVYEGDPRSTSRNTSVISSTLGISKNGLHVYYDILSIL